MTGVLSPAALEAAQRIANAAPPLTDAQRAAVQGIIGRPVRRPVVEMRTGRRP